MTKKSFVFILGLFFHTSLSGFDLSSQCSRSGSSLINLTRENSRINFALDYSYNFLAKRLGNGQFGVVKLSTTDGVNHWPDELGGKTAIKFVNLNIDPTVSHSTMKNLLTREMNAMYKIQGQIWAPRLYACVNADPFYYIAMEALYAPLDDKKAIAQFPLYKHWEISERFIVLWRGLKEQARLNIVHNDIKKANIMASYSDWTGLKFIDYGFANALNSLERDVERSGTAHYFSPNRLKGKKHLILDDFYALTVSIAELIDSSKSLFVGHYNTNFKKLVDLPDSCFEKERTDYCTKRLVENSSTIFSNAGFGQYQSTENDISKMTGTTLFVKTIEFNDAFAMKSYDTILNRLEQLNKQYEEDKLAFETKEKKRLEEEQLAKEMLRVKAEERERYRELKKKQEHEALIAQMNKAEEDQKQRKKEAELKQQQDKEERERKDKEAKLKRQKETEEWEKKRKEADLKWQKEMEELEQKRKEIALQEQKKRDEVRQKEKEAELKRLKESDDFLKKFPLEKDTGAQFNAKNPNYQQPAVNIRERLENNNLHQKVNDLISKKQIFDKVQPNINTQGFTYQPTTIPRVTSYDQGKLNQITGEPGVNNPIQRIASLNQKATEQPATFGRPTSFNPEVPNVQTNIANNVLNKPQVTNQPTVLPPLNREPVPFSRQASHKPYKPIFAEKVTTGQILRGNTYLKNYSNNGVAYNPSNQLPLHHQPTYLKKYYLLI